MKHLLKLPVPLSHVRNNSRTAEQIFAKFDTENVNYDSNFG
jgi:hypothetical protein